MAYCTKADILERIAEDELARLTDDENGTTVDDSIVSRAITDADAEIDLHLAARHALPLPSTPPVILTYSCEIAIFKLYSRRMGPPDYWQALYDNASKALKLIADGKVSLGLSTGDEPDPGAPVELTSNDRQMTRDKLKGF